MADYDLYYWPLPFRGQFIRAILAYAGRRWDEHGSEAIAKLMKADPIDQPVAFMGPPILIEKSSGFAISEMPAIAVYLGDTLGLIPDTAEARAMTAKIVNDANDVIDEITLNGGRQMWTRETWDAFIPRLQHWMAIWEASATHNGVEKDGGFLLGTKDAGVADIVTSTLWSTMADRFPAIGKIFEESAPKTAALSRRLQNIPVLAALSKAAFEQYGDAYCGGEIEKSLRKVAGG